MRAQKTCGQHVVGTSSVLFDISHTAWHCSTKKTCWACLPKLQCELHMLLEASHAAEPIKPSFPIEIILFCESSMATSIPGPGRGRGGHFGPPKKGSFWSPQPGRPGLWPGHPGHVTRTVRTCGHGTCGSDGPDGPDMLARTALMARTCPPGPDRWPGRPRTARTCGPDMWPGRFLGSA